MVVQVVKIAVPADVAKVVQPHVMDALEHVLQTVKILAQKIAFIHAERPVA